MTLLLRRPIRADDVKYLLCGLSTVDLPDNPAARAVIQNQAALNRCEFTMMVECSLSTKEQDKRDYQARN